MRTFEFLSTWCSRSVPDRCWLSAIGCRLSCIHTRCVCEWRLGDCCARGVNVFISFQMNNLARARIFNGDREASRHYPWISANMIFSNCLRLLSTKRAYASDQTQQIFSRWNWLVSGAKQLKRLLLLLLNKSDRVIAVLCMCLWSMRSLHFAKQTNKKLFSIAYKFAERR